MVVRALSRDTVQNALQRLFGYIVHRWISFIQKDDLWVANMGLGGGGTFPLATEMVAPRAPTA